MILREVMLVFTASESALAFHRWARAYFRGALDGGGSQLLPAGRVKLRGLYAGEAVMFAREAGKMGGVIELQPPQEDRAHV